MDWWLRYGNFRKGLYGLPHMGDVITFYSVRRGFSTQETVARAAGVSKETVKYWQSKMYLPEMDRRVFLAKLLRISPELLGLTVYSVLADPRSIEGYTNQLKKMTELAQEDSYYAYEDILVMGWDCLRKGSTYLIADRVERRLKKLERIVGRTIPPELVEWHMFFGVTEARLYLAKNEVEASVLSAKTALAIGNTLASQSTEEEIKSVYDNLREIDKHHPDVVNLGVLLGYF